METTETNDKQPASEPRDPRALNAYRHGLTGRVHIVSELEQAAYDKHCRSASDCFHPIGIFEISLVQSIADDRWQLLRAASIEEEIFGEGLTQHRLSGLHPEVEAANANLSTWLNRGKELERLALYAHRIQRRLEKNIAMLREIHVTREAAVEKAIEEVAALTDLAEKTGKTYDAEESHPHHMLPVNFDFSRPGIVERIEHRRRLNELKSAPGEAKKRLQTAA